jgi:MFS family permease
MTADTLHAGVPPKQPSMRRLIVAATIGNIFEWFDFVVYGFFAVTLSEVFFPAGNPTVSLLVTFGAFGLAYFVRPLGAIVVGGYTDRAGRKAGLLLSMALMMIGTTLMALTPGTRRSALRRRSSSRSPDCCRDFRSAANLAARSVFWPSTAAGGAASAPVGNSPPTA